VIAGKTWREIRVMALVYLLILEMLLIPVIYRMLAARDAPAAAPLPDAIGGAAGD